MKVDKCKQCGKAIVYIGTQWRHVHGNPRHIAKPAGKKIRDKP